MESDPKMAPIIITAHQEVRLRETLDKMEDFNVHISTLGIMNDLLSPSAKDIMLA